MSSVSIGAILGLFGTIGTLILVFSIVNMMSSALTGDTEAVERQVNEFTNDTLEDAKKLPLRPIQPYVIWGVAIILTAICSALGIPIVFKR